MKQTLIDLKPNYIDKYRSELLDIMIDFCDLEPTKQDELLQSREAIAILLFTSLFTRPTREYHFDIIGDVSMNSQELRYEIGEISSNSLSVGDAKEQLLENMMFLEQGYSAIHFNHNLKIEKLGVIYLPSSERGDLIEDVESEDIIIEYINIYDISY